MSIKDKILSFVNNLVDGIVDHAVEKIESKARELDAKYNFSAKIQQVIDFIKKVVDDLEKE